MANLSERLPLLTILLDDTRELVTDIDDVFFSGCVDTEDKIGQASIECTFDYKRPCLASVRWDADSHVVRINISIGLPVMLISVFSTIAQMSDSILMADVATLDFRVEMLDRTNREKHKGYRDIAELRSTLIDSKDLESYEKFLSYILPRDLHAFSTARAYWRVAMHFVLCHELAHVVSGQQLMEHHDPNLYVKTCEKWDDVTIAHAKEHICDLHAAMLTIISSQRGLLSNQISVPELRLAHTENGRIEIARTAIGIFWLLMADADLSQCKGGSSLTHPHIWDRWYMLEISRTVADNNEEQRSHQRAFTQSLLRCMTLIGTPGYFEWDTVMKREMAIDRDKILDAVIGLSDLYEPFRIGIAAVNTGTK